MRKSLFSNGIVRKLATWIIMLIVGAIVRKIMGQTPPSSKSSRKYVKNKTK